MRMGLCVLMILSLAGCATASRAPVAIPEPVRLPPPPIPAGCRPELLNVILRPTLLPEVVSVREALSAGAADRALASTNADIGEDLQACVRALISQRANP